MSLETIFLYGPPGSGKTSLGRSLAETLDLPFWDLDAEIEAGSGMSVPEIFTQEGEGGFRARENRVLTPLLAKGRAVIALGGGALLNGELRARVEAGGRVVCLSAPLETLLDRLHSGGGVRPLLAGDPRERLERLLALRAEHYASFPLKLDTTGGTPAELAWQAQVRLGAFRVRGMGAGYDARVAPGGLSQVGEALRTRGLRGPVALVSDEHVAAHYAPRVLASLGAAGYEARLVCIPAGEEYKTMDSVMCLWKSFLEAGLERGSTVLALGGGVVGDLAGFAAAVYLRGIAWVGVPTTLLSMVDASLGGKTGADLPQGKNLVGAFHPPGLVLADPQVLGTLPDAELRSGMAEVVKHGVIADPELFARCRQGWEAVQGDWDEIVRRAMAVKIQVIQEDPYEQGRRAALNLGHTLGHAVEKASDYRLRHGEAVAIGMASAARLAARLGLAGAELPGEIVSVLKGLGLPTEIPPELDRGRILQAMGVDKKRVDGRARFALPVRVGDVRVGLPVEEAELSNELERGRSGQEAV